MSEEKIASAFEYETSPLFDARERAALRVAQFGSFVPNETWPEHFEALHEDFDDGEIVSVISRFGYLNRWNDTMATGLEEPALAFGRSVLTDAGGTPGKHA